SSCGSRLWLYPAAAPSKDLSSPRHPYRFSGHALGSRMIAIRAGSFAAQKTDRVSSPHPVVPDGSERPRVCVVGAGMRFLSGISCYTLRLTNALAEAHPVSAILMRQLLPTRLYPGWKRVGMPLS